MKRILLISQYFYPAKLYGIMASGRPIIAIMSENTEVALTLNEYQCGLIPPPKDVHALLKPYCG